MMRLSIIEWNWNHDDFSTRGRYRFCLYTHAYCVRAVHHGTCHVRNKNKLFPHADTGSVWISWGITGARCRKFDKRDDQLQQFRVFCTGTTTTINIKRRSHATQPLHYITPSRTFNLWAWQFILFYLCFLILYFRYLRFLILITRQQWVVVKFALFQHYISFSFLLRTWRMQLLQS